MNATLVLAIPALGWALIEFLWQGALVGLAVAISLMLLRNARPQARYAVCCAALALCLALPVIGVWMGTHADASADATPAARFVQLTDTSDHHLSAATPETSWQSSLQDRLPWIVALWSLGAALLAARMALGMTWVARAGRVHGHVHLRWQQRLDRLAGKIGVECKVSLRVLADLATPVAAGCWKPVVLVPAALIANMPLDLLEALLAHELAHIRRHDYLVNLIQSSIEALLFYHPVVWWLSRSIRIEREQIADDLAAQALGEPRRLALALHELDLFQDALRHKDGAEGFITNSLLPAAKGGHLMSRIQRLIRPNQHALSWNIALPIIGLTAVCMAVYAQGAPDTPVAPHAAVTADANSATSSTPAPAKPNVLRIRNPGDATFTINHASARRDDAYAVVRSGQDDIEMSGDSRDISVIEKTRQKVHGDFVWVRRGSKTYVVQDPATVASVMEALKPAQALDARMDVLDKKMEGPNQQMEELDRQMKAFDDGDRPYNEAMEKANRQMDALARQQEALGKQMEAMGDRMEHASDAQREALDRQMQALQAQMDPLDLQMDKLSREMDEHGKQIEAAHKPMEELGRQMEEAGKPMEELGKQIEALGKREEQLSREAESRIHVLVDEAIRAGKAQPFENIQRD